MAYLIQQVTIQQIKVHLDGNAARYGAMRTAENWNGLTDLLNDPTTSVGVVRRMIQIHELCEAIDRTGFEAITAVQRESVMFLLHCAQGELLDAQNTVIRSFFGAFASTGQTAATRTRLDALQTKTGSYAEAAWGDGVRVNARDVEAAARL